MSNQVTDKGIITKIDGNILHIAIKTEDNCEGCGIKFLCAPKAGEDKIIKLENSIDSKVGDAVEISEASNVLLTLSILQYGLPLIGFLAGIFISYNMVVAFKPIELFQFIIGLIGLGIAAGISYLIVKWIAKKPDRLYRVVKL